MSKTLTEVLVDLRLDLKDSGTLWSDGELTRSVKRAVSDLSRFLPLERSFETTIDLTVTNESFTTLVASDTDKYVAAKNISASVAGDTCTLAAKKPDAPRPVIVTVTDANASISLFTIIVKGRDADGRYIEESFYFDNGLVQTGVKYFGYITEVEIDAITGNGAADVLDVGTGSPTGVWIDLANKPIKPRTETVTIVAGTTTYTRDTDYLMDDINGRIALKSGTTMAAATAHYIDYTKSKICIDINSLTDFIRAQRVEYPARNMPQTFVSFDIWNRILTLAGESIDPQSEVSDKEHAVIQYYAEHSPPATSAPASYPSFLDATVELAAGAYAMFTKAIQYEHQAVTDFASSRTALGNTGAIHTLIATALGKVTTHAAEMSTALAAAIVQAAAAATALAKINSDSGRTYLTDADTALDAAVVRVVAAATALANINAAGMPSLTDADTALDAFVTAIADASTALGKVNTYLAGATESTKALLAQIATDAAQLRTAIGTAVDAANTTLDGVSFTDVATYLASAVTALAKVTTYSETNTNENAKFWLTKITTDIADLRTAIETALDAVATYSTGATLPSAKKYLDDGDAFINKVNDGSNVAENYANYAGTCVSLVSGLVNEATVRLANLRSYIEQSEGWGSIAAGFVNEASQEVNMASQAIARERSKVEQATGYIAEANMRLANLRVYIEQANAYSVISDGFIAEANQQIARASSRITEAGQRLAIADRYLAEAREQEGGASAYIAEASQRVAIADRYISEASQRVAAATAYIAEAAGRYNMCRAFAEEASARIAQIDRHLAESAQYNQIAAANIELASQFRTEAIERRNEAWTIWRDSASYRGDASTTALRQPSSYK